MFFLLNFNYNFRILITMLKYIISLAILVAHLSSAQEMEGYDQEVVSNWSSGPFLNDLNQQCIEDCNKTCVRPCPEAVLCKSDEIQCGKEERPADVWPDCIQDDKCVPDDCECKLKFILSPLTGENIF